ncbi:MAG: outer membrane beta-barrel protein [Flammeovirgaceae bacterium]
MKKVLLILLMAFPSTLLFAQEGVKIGVGFGPAINFSRTETNDVLTAEDSGLGTRLSLTGRYGFSENYGLQTGVALTTKAFGDKDSNVGKTKVTTVEIPFGLALRTNELNTDGLYVTGFIGPTIDLNVSSRLNINGQDANNAENVQAIGSSIRFGLGAEKEFDFGTVHLGVTYARGLSNIAKDQAGVVTKIHYLAFEGIFFF